MEIWRGGENGRQRKIERNDRGRGRERETTTLCSDNDEKK